MSKPTLGGSLFVHDALRLDYCVEAAVESLCAACDCVVALDASSTDGTLDVLRALASRHGHLAVLSGIPWEPGGVTDQRRLAVLANMARSSLEGRVDWHFMLQADEVIHEDAIPLIRAAIEDPGCDAHFVRRVNLFGDLEHCIRFDLPLDQKPVSDEVVRLARPRFEALGDAESLAFDPARTSRDLVDFPVIFHYGLARDDEKHLVKMLEMQGWFWGPGGAVDPRAVAQAGSTGRFDWRAFKDRDQLMGIPRHHPAAALPWVEARRPGKAPVD